MIDEPLLHHLFGSMDDILEEERQTTPVETPMETDDKEANGNNHMLLPLASLSSVSIGVSTGVMIRRLMVIITCYCHMVFLSYFIAIQVTRAYV